MQEKTWRTVLRRILDEDHQEKKRIAQKLGTHPITLERWTKLDSKPRLFLLERLVGIVPEKYRAELRSLLEQAYPGIGEGSEEGGEGEELQVESISPHFADDSNLSILAAFLKDFEGKKASEYTNELFSSLSVQVLHLHTTVHPDERFWTICPLVLRAALQQLDPDRVGMQLLIARCMPPSPSTEKVNSLRESIAAGTFPWKSDIHERQFFLGAESLAGYVVSTRHSAVNQKIDTTSLLPVQWEMYEKSASVFPIVQADRVAGVLICSSTQVNYFTTRHFELLQNYTNLFSLGFNPHEFYPSSQIALRVLPPGTIQQEYFSRFRERVMQHMRNAMMQGKAMTVIEAELFVRQQLEETLTHLFPDGSTSDGSTSIPQ